MNKQQFHSKFAQILVVGGLCIFGFGLGMNIIGMFTVESLNDFIIGEGLRNALVAFAGAFVALIGTFVEKKAKEDAEKKSADE